MGEYYTAQNITKKEFVFGGDLVCDMLKRGWFEKENDEHVEAFRVFLETKVWSSTDQIEYILSSIIPVSDLGEYTNISVKVNDLYEEQFTSMNPNWCDICWSSPCKCYDISGIQPQIEKEEPVIPETQSNMCIELTKKGQPCKNKAKEGFTRCGPHQDKWEKEQASLSANLPEKPAISQESLLKEDAQPVEYDLPDPIRSVTPANAGVKPDTTVIIVERAQATEEPDLFIVAGTGSRSLQNASNEKKDILIAWLTARLTRLKEKYGEKLVIMSGMAEGFDKALAMIAIKLEIKLWCAIPSDNYGDYYWGKKSLTGRNMLAQYEDILSKAWRVTHVMPDPKGSNKYQKKYGSANFDRNDFMVEQGNAFLVYDPSSSGTAQCFATIKASGKPFELVPVV